ncbi:MAG: DEAD/DEAH box helicase family protein [Candidatus Omnitrophica bacterium]|nr:DEAD/DEAH box helicase family protein [Candidatus Omnitrophota bacterium]
MDKISLGIIKKTGFSDLYRKFVNTPDLSEGEKLKLLKLGVLFLNAEDLFVKKLGYRVILQYSNRYKDFIPLYDVAFNKGYIPIAKFIENKYITQKCIEKSFFNSFLSSYKENFKKDDIYLTEQQLEMGEDFIKNSNKAYVIVAPTSYGKSALMISVVYSYKNGNICILVPTKALLAQIKQRVINSKYFSNKKKIITHPEMYIEGDNNFIAILTQERLLRLLNKDKKLNFGLIFVDEAHNLLEDDSRNRLLATSIVALEKRNSHAIFKFLTPFLVNNLNLKVSHTSYSIQGYKIDEYLKIEKFYCYDFKRGNKLKLYDQFMDNFINTGNENYVNDIDLIMKKKGRKNIVYLNKPINIQEVADKIKGKLDLRQSERIKKACEDISKYLHKDYALIECLKYGVVYHHGSVPDNVRSYIEYLFSNEDQISFIVTSSTLLEGVNIPAEKLFILDYRKGQGKLSPSQFKNLVGRVCRFKEIFNSNNGDLDMLEPEIFLISSGYTYKKADIEKFLKGSIRADKKIKEKPENVLLKETEITESNKGKKIEAEEFLENIAPGTVAADTSRYAKTDIGKSCFANSIVEIDIIDNENELQSSVNEILIENIRAKTVKDVIDFMVKIFIAHIKKDDNFNEVKRLEREKTRNFYDMFLSWRIKGESYNQMINSFLRYWSKLEGEDALIYVGKWGEEKRGGVRKLWVDISKKSTIERINLAIIKIQEEQEFIDNKLIKFIEVMNDCNVIESGLYDTIKYGTNDNQKIIMIKNGMTLSLVNLLLEKYSSFITIDSKSNNVEIDSGVIKKMRSNGENEILVFEAEHNVKGK